MMRAEDDDEDLELGRAHVLTAEEMLPREFYVLVGFAIAVCYYVGAFLFVAWM